MAKKNKEISRENAGKISSIIGVIANVILSISKILVGVFTGFALIKTEV